MLKQRKRILNKKKGEEGITLIALVVTIAVLLIIVGITIMTVMGTGDRTITKTKEKANKINGTLDNAQQSIQNIKSELDGMNAINRTFTINFRSGSDGSLMVGGIIEIYEDYECTKLVKRIEPTQTYEWEEPFLANGKYYIKDIQVPNGYHMHWWVQPFEIKGLTNETWEYFYEAGQRPPSLEEYVILHGEDGVYIVWEEDEAATRPTEVEIALSKNGEFHHKIKMNSTNSWNGNPDIWRYDVSSLTQNDRWNVEVTTIMEDYGVDVYKYSNKKMIIWCRYKKKESGNIERRVNIVWNDEGERSERPTSVSVQLLCNGEAYGSLVTLNESNNWRYGWTELSASNTWNVEVRGFNSDKYNVEINLEGIVFVVTFSYVPELPPDDPELPPDDPELPPDVPDLPPV